MTPFFTKIFIKLICLTKMIEKRDVHEDERGKLVEIFKIPGVGQVLYSTTKPGVERGGHYHTRKEEKFCVVEGEGLIRQKDRGTGKIEEHRVSGKEPEVVELKKGWAHSIKNTGDKDMKLLIWVDEVYDPEDPDTFYEEL